MTHRCKKPDATKYPIASVFSCDDCGRTYALVASWVERPALRQKTALESNRNEQEKSE